MANILIVDDDEDLLHLTRNLLASQKHNVMVAHNAIEGIDLIGKFPFHLIITDANMPQYSGFDLAKTIRNQDKLKNLKIAMLTGRKEKRDIDRAVHIGVDDYIVKPIDPILFLKKIERLLETDSDTETLVNEVDISSSPSLTAAKLEYAIKLRSISEMGIVIFSTHPMAEGKLAHINSQIFETLEIAPPHLKVLSCIQFRPPNNGFEVRLAFFGIDDATLQKIRSWIFKTQIQQKAS